MLFKIKIFLWRIYIFFLGKKRRHFITARLFLYKSEYISQRIKHKNDLGFKATCHFLRGLVPHGLHRLVGKHFGGDLNGIYWWELGWSKVGTYKHYTESDPRVKLFNYLIELYGRRSKK